MSVDVDVCEVPEDIKQKALDIMQEHQARHPHHHSSFAVDRALEYLSGVVGGFGTAGAVPLCGSVGGFSYVNMGRSCQRTVVYDFLLGSFRWGVAWEDVLFEHEGAGIGYP